jgi:hypothetical protein
LLDHLLHRDRPEHFANGGAARKDRPAPFITTYSVAKLESGHDFRAEMGSIDPV